MTVPSFVVDSKEHRHKPKNIVPEEIGLPCEAVFTGHSAWPYVLCACFMLLVTLGFIFGKDVDGRKAGPWPPTATGCVCAAFLFVAHAVRVAEKRYLLSTDEVTCRKRSVFGNKEWTESLAGYRGVLMREVYHPSTGGEHPTPAYTQYLLDLQHGTDERRNVELYDARNANGFRSQHERYCRLFGLPALRKTDDETVEERAVDDLDKNVRDKVSDGSMPVEFSPSTPPQGNGIAVGISEGCMRVSASPPLDGARAIVNALSLIAALKIVFALWMGLRHEPHGPAKGVILLFIVAAVRYLIVLWMARPKQELLISPEQVTLLHTSSLGKTRTTNAAVDAIEDVSIRTIPGPQEVTAVVLETDEQRLVFGEKLSAEQKRWVRDCAIAVIAGGQEPLGAD